MSMFQISKSYKNNWINLKSKYKPIYNTVHYNTVLDITQFKMDPNNVKII